MLSIRGKGEWDWNGNTVILKPDNDVRGFAHKHVVACSWLMDRKIKKMMVLFKQNKTALFRESKVTQGSKFVLIGAKWSTRALWIVQYSNALGFSWVYSVQHSACLKIQSNISFRLIESVYQKQLTTKRNFHFHFMFLFVEWYYLINYFGKRQIHLGVVIGNL